MDDETFDKIRKFIIDNRWKYKFPLTRETQLQRDLKIWGDDADEILIKFSEVFNVDIEQFPVVDYFDGEGGGPFSDITRLFSRRKKTAEENFDYWGSGESCFEGSIRLGDSNLYKHEDRLLLSIL